MNSKSTRQQKKGVLKVVVTLVVILYICVNLRISRHHDHDQQRQTSGNQMTSSMERGLDTTETGGTGGLVQRLEEFRRGNNDGREDSALNIIKMSTSSSSTNATNQPEKLQTILDKIYIQTNHTYDGHLWDVSLYVPQWMKDYFVWHHEQRQKHFTKSNFVRQSASFPRLWIMQCLRDQDEDKCGGTADRLKPFLYQVRAAYEQQRLLLIYWTKPARLEEFLVPPKGGIDWRVPAWLQPVLDDRNIGKKFYKIERVKKFTNENDTVVRTRYQSVTGGSQFYDKKLQDGEYTFNDVYHDAWRIFFTPSKPVAQLIQTEMDRMELIPGEYAAAHMRALYGRVESRTTTEATEWTQNACNCASKLRPGGPIFFASDHTESTTIAIQYGKEKHTKIVSRNHDKLPLHLDKVDNWKSIHPSEFYDVFVDLYVMGMSRCLTYNRGGFGQWALLIGYNASCVEKQKTSDAGIGTRCNWTEPTTAVLREDGLSIVPPLFQEAME